MKTPFVRFGKSIAVTLTLTLALAGATPALQGQEGGPPPKERPGRPAQVRKPKGEAFSQEKNPEARKSLYQEWRKSRSNKFKDQGEGNGITPVIRSHSGGAALPQQLQLVNGENVGRASIAMNSAGSVLFTKILGGAPDWTSSTAFPTGRFVLPTSGKNNPWRFQATTGGTTGGVEPNWPTTLGATIGDGSITWTARTGPCDPDPQNSPNPPFPAYSGGKHQGDIGPGCQPMQLVVRSSGGSETVIAQEGDAIVGGGGDVLTGWGEYYDLNGSGVAAFKAEFAPQATTFSTDENSSGLFTAGPGGGNIVRHIKSGDVVSNIVMCGFGPQVMINTAGQVGFEGYAIATPWKPTTASSTFLRNRVTPTVPNGFYFTVQSAGTTGASEPVWPTTAGATVVDGTVTWQAVTFDCRNAGDENHQLLRFTSGPGVQRMFGVGTDIGGGVFVKRMGQGNDQYDNIDRHFTTSGHLAIVAILSDANSSQAVYLVTAPGTFTEVARTGVSIAGIGLVDQIGDKLAINDSDQVLMKLSIGGDGNPSTQDQGADTLVLFTPPSTYTKVAMGRTGPSPGGRGCSGTCGPGPLGDVIDSSVSPAITIEGFGAHFDMNNNGDVVFKAGLEQCSAPNTCVGFPGVDSNELASVFFWDNGTSTLTELARTGKLDDRNKTLYGFFTEVITVNDSKVVLFGNRNSGSFVQGDPNDLYVALYDWTPSGGLKSIAQVGDMLNGSPISGIFPQHIPFSKQLSSSSKFAVEAFVNDDDPDDAGDFAHNGMLLLGGVTCPPITVNPKSLPGGAVGVSYSQTITASGGASPFTFNVTGGSLPPGLNLSSGGLLSGTPTGGGSFNFTITATDNNGCTGSRAYSVSISTGGCSAPNLSVDPSIASIGKTVMLSWNGTLAAGGGSYTVQVSINGSGFFGVGTVPASGFVLETFTYLLQTPGTYDFRVLTVLRSCSATSNTVQVIATGPCPQAPTVTGLAVDPTSAPPGATFTLTWDDPLGFSGAFGVFESTDGGQSFHQIGTTSGTSFTGIVPGPSGITLTFAVEALGCVYSSKSNFATLQVACNAPGPVTDIQVQAFGVSPPRAPSPTEYILVSWKPPATGTTPIRYGVRINGDPEVLVVGTSVVLPPRGTPDPITAFVTAYACAGLTSAELFDPVSGIWSITGNLKLPRQAHTATLLGDGRVLVAGGVANQFTSPSPTSELYDPAAATWSTSGTLLTPRDLHAATGLSSGPASSQVLATTLANADVLVEGGFGTQPLASSELYKAATGKWSGTASLATARNLHTATLLANGKVLVVGGLGSAPLAAAELYDPGSETWTATGSLATARYRHTATLLADGKVLVVGGFGAGGALSSAELYDPTAGTWSSTGALATAREGHSAARLSSGKVLVAGGDDGAVALASAELYDPAAGTWTATGSLLAARRGHTATLLSGGQVLIAAGFGAALDKALKSAELYEPGSGSFSSTGSLNGSHGVHTATLLGTGRVLVAGFADTIGTEVVGPTASGPPVALFLQPPVASFTISANPRVGTPVTFTDTSSPQATSWLWIFDDGTSDTRQNPTHTFTATGTHQVSLIASNGAGSSTATQTFVVAAAAATVASRPAPVSSIALDASDPGRRRARVEIAGLHTVLLRIRTNESVETIVFLRFLGPTDNVVCERRLSIQPGAEAVYDLGAYGLQGGFAIELVSNQNFESTLSVIGRPSVREIHR